jgi:hypothetical protein
METEKNKEGRPLKYKTEKQLQTAIDTYFRKCKPKMLKNSKGKILTNSNGVPIIELNPPTLSGLALHLGFASRQSVYDYEERGEFSYTVKVARLRCENWVETGLLAGSVNPSAGNFVLKNYGWKDKQEIEQTGPSTLTDEIAKAVLAKHGL